MRNVSVYCHRMINQQFIYFWKEFHLLFTWSLCWQQLIKDPKLKGIFVHVWFTQCFEASTPSLERCIYSSIWHWLWEIQKSTNPNVLPVWGLYRQWLFPVFFCLAFHLSVHSFDQCCYSSMKDVTLCLMLHPVSRRSAKILFTTTVECSFLKALWCFAANKL